VRHADGSYDVAGWDTERRAYPEGSLDQLMLYARFAAEGRDPWLVQPGTLVLVRDFELGQRASEHLDMWEDEADIRWWAELARMQALFKLDLAGG
jgi:hypothetical protein